MDLEAAGASVICLPDEGNHVQPGTEQCFTAGWGSTDYDSDDYVTDTLVSLAVNIYGGKTLFLLIGTKLLYKI